MGEYAVSIKNLCKIYRLYEKPINRLKEVLHPLRRSYHKDFYALRDISFDIKKGQTLGIIGTNGSGKSTLLKILTGVLTPSGGEFEVNGKVSALLELGAGFNPQYTGMENIYLNGTVMGYSKAEIDMRIDDIVRFADIGDFIHQPVHNYSSGMFARLAFAVAINVDPDILIVDEALSVGDIYFQVKCYKKFDEFKAAGKTILFVSHDLTSIIKYCDETVLINNGDLVAKGKSNEMVDLYKKILSRQAGDADGPSGPDGFSFDGADLISSPAAAEGKSWKSALSLNAQALNYGNGKAKIVDFAIQNSKGKISNVTEKNKAFAIVMKVRFTEDVRRPIFAFTIKDRKGTEITGTNTYFERYETPDGKAGQTVTVQFEQSMRLQGGQYLLCLGCTGYEGDELCVYDRLYDACAIDVLSQKDTIGFFDTNSKITLIPSE